MSMAFENRIIGTGEANIEEILFNPKNWRIHPKYQQDALEGVLENVGWVQNVIINTETGNLVDGHLRVQLANKAGEKTIPAIYVNLSEEEENIVLASIDPIGAMAETDREKLEELIGLISTDDEKIAEMISKISDENKLFVDNEGDGIALSLMDLTLGEPRHQVNVGDVYEVENHIVICASPLTDSVIWLPYMNTERWFLGYPNPLSLLTEKVVNLLAVSPSTYMVGHMLDRWEDFRGTDGIRKIS